MGQSKHYRSALVGGLGATLIVTPEMVQLAAARFSTDAQSVHGLLGDLGFSVRVVDQSMLALETSGNLEQRFWSKVRKTEGCWLWTAARGYWDKHKGPDAKKGQGYGILAIGAKNLRTKKTEYAHRISWMLTNGPIPDALWVLHKCDNPQCVRPDHLFLGDRDDNVADMCAKGRWNSPYKIPITHCKRGHPFTNGNYTIGGKGERRCSQCRNLHARAYRAAAA